MSLSEAQNDPLPPFRIKILDSVHSQPCFLSGSTDFSSYLSLISLFLISPSCADWLPCKTSTLIAEQLLCLRFFSQHLFIVTRHLRRRASFSDETFIFRVGMVVLSRWCPKGGGIVVILRLRKKVGFFPARSSHCSWAHGFICNIMGLVLNDGRNKAGFRQST